jgi:hypothetical protein
MSKGKKTPKTAGEALKEELTRAIEELMKRHGLMPDSSKSIRKDRDDRG